MTMTNLVLRFATEIAGIAAVAYAGFQVDAPAPVRVVVGILLGLLGTEPRDRTATVTR
jgi:hypothetical protein